MMKRDKIFRNVWHIYIVMVAALIIYTAVSYSDPYMKDGFNTGECYEEANGWQYIGTDGKYISNITLPADIKVPEGTRSVAIRKVLPQYISGGWYLAVSAPLNTVKVSINGIKVCEYNGNDGLLKTVYPANEELFIPLKKSYGGDSVTVVFGSPYASYCSSINMVYIGDRTDIIYRMVMNNMPALAGGMLMAAFGIAMLFLRFTMGKKIRYRQESTYIGIFVLFVGIWMCLQTGMAQLFFTDISYARSLEFFALMMIAVPVIMMADRITKYRYHRSAAILCILDIISVFSVFILVFGFHIDYLDVNIINLLMLAAAVIYTFTTMVMIYINDRELFNEHRWLVYAYASLGLTAMMEIGSALVSRYMKTGRFMAVGALMYCFCIYKWASMQIQAEEVRKEVVLRQTASKRDFLANVSHEIRTPVNAVISIADRMQKEAGDTETAVRAADISEAAEHLLSLINKILDSSRIESGRLSVSEESYRTATLLKDLRDMTARYGKYAAAGVRTVFRYSPDLPSEMCGDETKICQMMSYLIENACAHTREGAVIVAVDAADDGSGNELLRFNVRDTGSGIAKEDIPTLFNRFRHISDGNAGTGLGLYIARAMSNMMKGDITVESTLGIGSDFCVRIRQRVVSDTPVGNSISEIKGQAACGVQDTAGYSGLRVLIVDDEAMNRRIADELLRDMNISADQAADGNEALQAVSRRRYDLILMDHLMPGMRGEEVCAQIRNGEDHLNSEACIYMLTAEDSSELDETIRESGFNGMIMKPLTSGKLATVLEQLAAGGAVR
jgi:signal transduction histidine kinase